LLLLVGWLRLLDCCGCWLLLFRLLWHKQTLQTEDDVLCGYALEC
jgi:hypothetical protein